MRFLVCLIILLVWYGGYKYSAKLEFIAPVPEIKSLIDSPPKYNLIPLKKKLVVTRSQKFVTSFTDHDEAHGLDILVGWEDEMYEILQHLDPENAQIIFKNYKDEKRKHNEEISRNLLAEVTKLSLLNGESIDQDQLEEKNQYSANLELLEINHQKKIKKILGDHYEYIQTQYALQKETH